MRILVLGAAGFIGRHIISELVSAGHEPVACVRRRDGRAQNRRQKHRRNRRGE